MSKLPNELYLKIFGYLEYDFITFYEIKYFDELIKKYGNLICFSILTKYNFAIKKDKARESLKTITKYNKNTSEFTLSELYEDEDLKLEILDLAIKDKDKIMIDFLLDNGCFVEPDYIKGLIDYHSSFTGEYKNMAKTIIHFHLDELKKLKH